MPLFVKAEAEELPRFRGRMNVLPGEAAYGKTLTERRLPLKSKEAGRLNRIELQKTADMYGLTITGITFPYRPAFFGHAFFNTSFLGGPSAFSVLLLRASWSRAGFWALFTPGRRIQRFGIMRFGLERMVYFPVSHLRRYLEKTLRAACAGFCGMGTARLFPSPVYLPRPFAEKRLRGAPAGFMRLGADRLIYSPFPAMRRITARRIPRGSAGFPRLGRDRLMYTAAPYIRRAVYDRPRSYSAGFSRRGQSRLMPAPFYAIGKLLEKQFRAVSYGSAYPARLITAADFQIRRFPVKNSFLPDLLNPYFSGAEYCP